MSKFKIWLWYEATKHDLLYKVSLNYRQALRVIEMQDDKIDFLFAELNSIKSVSPFKGPRQFLADAIKEGETNE